MSAFDIEALPSALRLTVRDFLSGYDLRKRLSRTTFFRQRRELLAYGIDIGAAPPSPALSEAPQCPADTWDWISHADVLRVASQALEDAQRLSMRPTPADEGPDGWYTREYFADSLAHVLRLRLAELAASRGVAVNPRDLEDLAAWLGPDDAAEPRLRG